MNHNRKKKKNLYNIQFLYRPGLWLTDADFKALVEQFRETAASCFDEIPNYQVMVGTREELSDKVVSVAWRKDGKMAGFCSTILLPVKGVGNILHLGLTCVRPEDRGTRLTHLLTKNAVAGYIMRYKPMGRIWITNCAAVLSSLGNVSLHFDDVYPSPFKDVKPKPTHYKIAQAIDEYYRDKIYIMDEAKFDEEAFVFRGSVKETVFVKEEEDARFHHRHKSLNDFYQNLMHFENGDEVLQVGHASVLTALKYKFRNKKRLSELLAAEQYQQMPV